MTKILIKQNIRYDEDLLPIIEAGQYDYDEHGVNGWPMIKVNDEWWDWAADPDDKIWELV